MGFLEIFLIGVGLSMDAFAVSICKGLSVKKLKIRNLLICGIYFGVFQAIMPFTGYILGVNFQSYIESIDHWIAFVLLALIGGNMIREALSDEENETDDDFSFKVMIPLAVATSIDALAVGVTFAFLNVNIFKAITIIGCTTFVISMVGVAIGHAFGLRYKQKSEIVGGIILILIGLKILLEHLGILVL